MGAREAAEAAMKELEKRREAEERAALSEAERHLEDARADLAATVEEMGRASVEGGAEIGSLKERADAAEGELSKLRATLETRAIEAASRAICLAPPPRRRLSLPGYQSPPPLPLTPYPSPRRWPLDLRARPPSAVPPRTAPLSPPPRVSSPTPS